MINKLLWVPNPPKIRYQPKGKDMTYILGARCVDGVVLVGDTKITIDQGADFAYAKKIISPLSTIAMGSSGMGGIFKDFQNRVETKALRILQDFKTEGKMTITHPRDFSVLITKTIREMHDDYKEDSYLITQYLQVISAIRFPSLKTELNVFSGYGFPEPVNEKRAIGHGEPYGALFLREMWDNKMTMKQAAKLGIFIIKFIKDMKIDNSVGFNDEFLPQVICMPDVKLSPEFKIKYPPTPEDVEEFRKICDKYPVEELRDEEVQQLINEINPKLSDFRIYLKKDIFNFKV